MLALKRKHKKTLQAVLFACSVVCFVLRCTLCVKIPYTALVVVKRANLFVAIVKHHIASISFAIELEQCFKAFVKHFIHAVEVFTSNFAAVVNVDFARVCSVVVAHCHAASSLLLLRCYALHCARTLALCALACCSCVRCVLCCACAVFSMLCSKRKHKMH